MSENKSQFRGAAFGGFHRQDVLDYLAAIDAEHRSRMDACQSELDAERAAREKAQHELEQEKEESARRKDELERLQEERDALKTRLQELEARRQDTQAELDTAQEDLCRLREQVAELEPAAIAYERLKERAASIELDAHERAQVALDKAKEDREALREETIRWVARVKARYESFRGDVEGILFQSNRELERIREAFHQISQELGSHEESLEALMCACQEAVEVEE